MATAEVVRKTGVDRGDTLTFTALFVDAAGAALDPDSVTFYVIDPRGRSSETAYPFNGSGPVTHPATGTYALRLTVDRAGVWQVRALGVGDGTVVVRGNVLVRRDEFS